MPRVKTTIKYKLHIHVYILTYTYTYTCIYNVNNQTIYILYLFTIYYNCKTDALKSYKNSINITCIIYAIHKHVHAIFQKWMELNRIIYAYIQKWRKFTDVDVSIIT